MAIQSNFPALRPSLLLDFANSKRLDPRVTFTRASTARFYDGITTAKAEENLLLRSQDYSATWSVTSLTPVTGKTAPDATATATEFTASGANGTLTQSVTAVAGEYTFSVYLRRITGTGNIDISAHSGGTWVTQTLTGSWQRFSVTQTLTAGARTPGIRVVTSGDAIEVWGAQLEFRSSATVYTATTTEPITNYVPQLRTAAAGVPRFNHHPITDESLGLLIEESRTNTILQSEDFSTTWSATRATVSTNTRVAPDGTITSDRLIDTTDNNTHFVSQTFTGTAAAWTFAVYAKAAGHNFIALRLFNGTSQVGLAYYNLSTGATGTVTAGTASIVSVGNGWYRCVLTATLAASASCTADIQLASADGTNSFAGDGWKSVALWGAQVELGGFVTSYIPTVGSTATRSADVASMTDSNLTSWYRQDEGTFYAQGQRAISGVDPNNIFSARSVGSDLIEVVNAASGDTTRATFFMNFSGVTQYGATTSASVFPLNVSGRVALAFRTNDVRGATNGALAASDTSVILPTITRLGIGSRLTNAAGTTGERFFNGSVAKIAFYPLRLTDAQIQAITG